MRKRKAAAAMQPAAALKLLAKRMGWSVRKGNALVRLSDGLEWQPKSAMEQLAQLAHLAKLVQPAALEGIVLAKVPGKTQVAGWAYWVLHGLSKPPVQTVKRQRRKAAA